MERDGFHFAVFTPEEIETGEAWVNGWGRWSGHVSAYPGQVGIEAMREHYRRYPLAPGIYYVTGIRLRDHAAVFQRVEVTGTSITHEAVTVHQEGADPVVLEGEAVA